MIQIIGAGAIGCLWLAKLQQAKQTCHIVSRTKTLTKTLFYTDLQGETVQLPISHNNRLLNSTEIEQKSTILVCVKAHQVLPALLMQRKYITPKQPIILMHNGLGCAEEVAQHFPDNIIICSTTANASLLNSPLNITETGNGPTYMGPFNVKDNDCSHLSSPFQKATESVFWSDNIIEQCWLKLAINAIINPISAIQGINNGGLLQPEFTVLITQLISEILAISIAEKIKLEKALLQGSVYKVIEATSNNFSSMNRDIFYKRQTEIDFINGYLIKKSQIHNIEVPLLSGLFTQVKALENRSLIPANKK